jgi:release factor glutamine methyltransferase
LSISIDIEILFHQKLQVYYPKSEIDAILRLVSDEEMTDARAIDILKQLEQNKPIQYILQEAHFHRFSFYVDDQVLIPRPETEELVELIRERHDAHSVLSIIDCCTGSGCIAITLQKLFPLWDVSALEISAGAMDVAKKNATRWNANIHFIQDDVLHPSKEYKLFDLIVSNPPYIAEKERVCMSSQVVDYEPSIALFVDDNDPLIFYRALIGFAKNQLSANGFVYCEINERYGSETKDLFIKSSFFKKVDLLYDCSGKHRFIIAQK